MANSVFRKKSLDLILKDQAEGVNDGHGGGLKKILGVKDLTFMGVAAVIGAGVFSTIGSAAFNGGPGVIFLFLITAVTCGFTALCYAEFASRVPVSGSAYTYSYVTFGEMIAWIIGWALILEYAIGNIVVAISWSAYFNNILRAMNIHLPGWLTVGYQTARDAYHAAIAEGKPVDQLVYSNAPIIAGFRFIINLPAFIIVVLISYR
jgi:amino acid transporter